MIEPPFQEEPYMPRTTQITNPLDLSTVSIFNPAASLNLIQALKDGKKVEKTESSFSDPGGDYVKFLVDGKEVCHISGY